MSDDTRYQEAKERVELKLGFFIHAAVFVLVNIGLLVLDLTGTPGKVWFYWPLGGWGLGLALHAFRVFGGGASGLKQKLIEREMARQ